MIARELLTQFEPIDGTIQFAADPGEVPLIDKDQSFI
jgi:hypothetical protein